MPGARRPDVAPAAAGTSRAGPAGPSSPTAGPDAAAPPPVPRRRRRVVLVAGAALAVVVMGVVVGGLVWYEAQVGEGPAGPAVVVDLPAGSSTSAITATLARARVVHSSLALHIYLLLHGSPPVAPGRYQLRRDDDFAAVRARLAGGPNVFPVTVLPGATVAELSRTVDRDVPRWSGASFLAAATDGTVRSPFEPPGLDNLDGLLGPGTYTVLPRESEARLLRAMVARFDTAAAGDALGAAAAADGVTPYQAVTVASIVQKEAISPGEPAAVVAHNAGPVARVVYNRLARGMALQMDSTVLYAEGRDGGAVTPADEARPTPYNTYLHVGLTPTPICFPSAPALAAALHPPPGSWLYFELTARNGTETFSDTFAGQQAAEALARSRGLP